MKEAADEVRLSIHLDPSDEVPSRYVVELANAEWAILELLWDEGRVELHVKGGRWTMTPWRQRPTDLRVELPGGVRIGEYRAFRVRRGGRVDFGDSHRAQIGRRGLVWLSWRMRERDGDQRTLLRVRRQNDPGSGFVADVHRAVLADQLTALSVLVGLVIVLFDVLAPTPELGGGGGG